MDRRKRSIWPCISRLPFSRPSDQLSGAPADARDNPHPCQGLKFVSAGRPWAQQAHRQELQVVWWPWWWPWRALALSPSLRGRPPGLCLRLARPAWRPSSPPSPLLAAETQAAAFLLIPIWTSLLEPQNHAINYWPRHERSCPPNQSSAPPAISAGRVMQREWQAPGNWLVAIGPSANFFFLARPAYLSGPLAMRLCVELNFRQSKLCPSSIRRHPSPSARAHRYKARYWHQSIALARLHRPTVVCWPRGACRVRARHRHLGDYPHWPNRVQRPLLSPVNCRRAARSSARVPPVTARPRRPGETSGAESFILRSITKASAVLSR